MADAATKGHPPEARPGHSRSAIRLLAILPGALALALMLLSWLLPRSRAAVFLVFAGMLVLFLWQFTRARRLDRGPLRAAMIVFSIVLLYFALFGVVYAEYVDLAQHLTVFSTDRLGEAFLVSVSIGTATGYVPAATGAGDVGFLAIVNAQMIVLALGVAGSAAASMARLSARRQRAHADRGD